MLIEIHILQNHSPGNLNRDDLGAPKSAYFGGKLRGRISSQCIKRSIRRNDDFQTELQGHLGTRTKEFPELVREQLQKSGKIPEAEHARVVQKCTGIAKAEEKAGTKQEKDSTDGKKRTPQLIYLDPAHIGEFVGRLIGLREKMPEAYKYYLNPVAGFQEVLKAALEERDLDDGKLTENIIKNAWVIAKLRLPRLAKFEGEDEGQDVPGGEGTEPGETEAKWITERLGLLVQRDEKKNKDLLKEIQKPANKQEKEKLEEVEAEKPKGYDKFEEELFHPLKSNAVDIALFGRMTTSDAFEDVEACLEVAHAISTNEMVREVDYFTAIDDRGTGVAAAHVGENQFNSCTYYKYFSLDWNAFVNRLAGPKPDTKATEELARKALRALIRAVAFAVPSGKKKGHAHNNLPDAVLVEVKQKRVPTNYANAFLTPAAPSADGDLLADSIRKLGHYVALVSRGYGITTDRYWFELQQRPLAFTSSPEGNSPAKTVPLAGSEESFDALLDKVIAALSRGAA